MAIIRYNQANVTTQPMGLQTNVKATAESFTGGLDKTVSTVADVYAKEIQKADDAKVLKAKQELSSAANRFLNDKDTGVLNARGENAFNSEERYQTEFAPTVDSIKNGLNSRQRQLFDTYEFDITQNINKNIQGHLSKEIYAVDEANSKAFLENEQQSAVYNFTDFGEIEKSIERQKNEIKLMADRNGLPTEVAASNAMASESRTRTIVIEQLVNSNNAQSAKLYLDSNKEKMIPQDVIRLEKLVKDSADMQASQDAADKIISSFGRDPKAAIAEANKQFAGDTKMRDDVKKRVFGHFDEMDKAERLKKEDDFLYATNIVEQSRGVPAQDLVPKTMWSSFSLSERKSLEDFSRNGAPNSDDLQTYYDIQQMYANPATRNEFKNGNLMVYQDKLTQPSMKEFIKMQRDLRDGKDASADIDGIESKMSIVNNALRSAGINTQGKKASAESIQKANVFTKKVDDEVVKYLQNTGKKKITNDELRKITDDLMKEYVTGTSFFFFDKTKRKFDLKPEDVVPKDKLQRYIQILKNNKMEANEQNLWRLYETDTGE